jgi:demethylmenaquinone methyltransferase/2-methoxy-6-polyprenyl-1,4-benzoquinol methylase
MGALPSVARRVSSNPDAYVYLAESIRAWPDQAGLAAKVTDSGWEGVSWRNLTGGIVALHRAVRTNSQVRPTSPLTAVEASSRLHGESSL